MSNFLRSRQRDRRNRETAGTRWRLADDSAGVEIAQKFTSRQAAYDYAYEHGLEVINEGDGILYYNRTK